MKPIDRINILDKISNELKNRWTFTNIISYLSQYKIKPRNVNEYSSKYSYCQDVLKDVPDQVLFDIASELKIDYPFQSEDIKYEEGELKFWKSGYFKLFISHISSFKETVSYLKASLELYGISSFVAHEDIEPTKEWMIEIEKALSSMDAMAAILLPGFHESKWTDQEIGIAIGKHKLVIPITKGIDPYGFLGKYQGFKANGKKINEVSSAIFKILCNNEKTKNQIFNVITNLFLISISISEAIQRLSIIEKAENYSKEYAEKLAEQIIENKILIDNSEIINKANFILNRFGIERIKKSKVFSIKEIISPDDDLPF